jgi:hypothetical protein
MAAKSKPGDGGHNTGIRGGYTGWLSNDSDDRANVTTIVRRLRKSLDQLRSAGRA